MNESNALISFTRDDWQMIREIAPAMHTARFFGVANPEQAIAIMLKGHFLGFDPAASFEFIQVVQNRPALSPRGALAILQSSSECEAIKIDDLTDDAGKPTGCRVYMKRRNGFEYTITYSMEDAQQAGLVKPDSGWAKYPANMLRWRAIGFCADVVFPDVIGGLKRADELGAAISPSGDVIEGTWQPVVEPQPTPQPAQIEAKISLGELVTRYGAEAVMQAAGGMIPGTDDQVAEVAKTLAESEAGNG